jgi:hypothetical protein
MAPQPAGDNYSYRLCGMKREQRSAPFCQKHERNSANNANHIRNDDNVSTAKNQQQFYPTIEYLTQPHKVKNSPPTDKPTPILQ